MREQKRTIQKPDGNGPPAAEDGRTSLYSDQDDLLQAPVRQAHIIHVQPPSTSQAVLEPSEAAFFLDINQVEDVSESKCRTPQWSSDDSEMDQKKAMREKKLRRNMDKAKKASRSPRPEEMQPEPEVKPKPKPVAVAELPPPFPAPESARTEPELADEFDDDIERLASPDKPLTIEDSGVCLGGHDTSRLDTSSVLSGSGDDDGSRDSGSRDGRDSGLPPGVVEVHAETLTTGETEIIEAPITGVDDFLQSEDDLPVAMETSVATAIVTLEPQNNECVTEDINEAMMIVEVQREKLRSPEMMTACCVERVELDELKPEVIEQKEPKVFENVEVKPLEPVEMAVMERAEELQPLVEMKTVTMKGAVGRFAVELEELEEMEDDAAKEKELETDSLSDFTDFTDSDVEKPNTTITIDEKCVYCERLKSEDANFESEEDLGPALEEWKKMSDEAIAAEKKANLVITDAMTNFDLLDAESEPRSLVQDEAVSSQGSKVVSGLEDAVEVEDQTPVMRMPGAPPAVPLSVPTPPPAVLLDEILSRAAGAPPPAPPPPFELKLGRAPRGPPPDSHPPPRPPEGPPFQPPPYPRAPGAAPPGVVRDPHPPRAPGGPPPPAGDVFVPPPPCPRCRERLREDRKRAPGAAPPINDPHPSPRGPPSDSHPPPRAPEGPPLQSPPFPRCHMQRLPEDRMRAPGAAPPPGRGHDPHPPPVPRAPGAGPPPPPPFPPPVATSSATTCPPPAATDEELVKLSSSVDPAPSTSQQSPLPLAAPMPPELKAISKDDDFEAQIQQRAAQLKPENGELKVPKSEPLNEWELEDAVEKFLKEVKKTVQEINQIVDQANASEQFRAEWAAAAKGQYVSKGEYEESVYLNPKFRNRFLRLRNIYFSLTKQPIKQREAFRIKVADILGKDENFLSITRATIEYSYNHGYDENGRLVESFMRSLVNPLTILYNFTDPSDSFTADVCKCPGMMTLLVKIAEEQYHKNIYDDADGVDKESEETSTQDKYNRQVVRACVAIVYNCSTRERNRKLLRHLGAVKMMIPYLDVPDEKFQLNALFCLAFLCDETESEIFQARGELIKFFLKKLEKALADDSRKCSGLSLYELTRACGRLAINDVNKHLLGEAGAVDILVRIASLDDGDQEARDATEALWTLSFEQSNKSRIRGNQTAMDLLGRLAQSEDKLMAKSAKGCLWTVRGRRESDIQAAPLVVPDENQIMISYQWKYQDLILRVRDRLRDQGYKIWIDVEQMSGATLETMARAVEQSRLVLVAMSQSYKDSSNCRAEAEYAFTQGKQIIPLKVEPNYRPEGWLGIIVGSKLYFDLSHEQRFEIKMTELIKEMMNHLQGSEPQLQAVSAAPAQSEPYPPHPHHPHRQPHPPAITRQHEITVNEDELREWLDNTQFKSAHLRDITVDHLRCLRNMKTQAPTFYYEYVQKLISKQTSMDELEDMATLTNKLDELG